MQEAIRIVVTGIGIVSSLGIGKDKFWKNLLAGKSGISKVSSFDTRDFRTHIAGEIKNFNPGDFMKNPEEKGRATQFLLAAVKLAIEDAKIKVANFNPKEVGLIIGTTALEPNVIEEINQILISKGVEAISPQLITKAAVRTPTDIIAQELGICGFVLAIPTACSAGNYAIGYGFDLIRQRRAKVVFCCGVDVFFKTMFAGFNRLLILAPDRCQPFDKNRKGTILGEGACVLALETLEDALRRKADIYAEVLGYGLSCDAYSMTISSEEGIRKVMERAIKNSGIEKKKIDHINAHGTGTINNDQNEAKAIRKVFGSLADRIPVTAIKSMLGHTLGAASALEAASCCLSLRHNIIPPTINYKTPDPKCDLDVVANRPRKKKLNIVMNNAFAFGGNNACVIFKKVNSR